MCKQTLGPLDFIAQDRKKHPVKPAVYKTPGVECQHATKGCCPRCRAPFPGKMLSRITDNIAGYSGWMKARMYAVSAKRRKRRTEGIRERITDALATQATKEANKK